MAHKPPFEARSVHYKAKGLTICSENAAKPAAQKSQAVCAWLRQQPSVVDALDYGCGKLRYAVELAARARRVTFVDSAIQVMRQQLLLGRRTTIQHLVSNRWPSSRVLDVVSFHADRRKYDLVLCANVLSAIPSRRVRLDVLRAISDRLKPGATCLLVSQYRNSDFNATASKPNAEPYEDGWILRGRRGPSFYAPLGASRVEAMARRAGLSLQERRLRDGAALIVVGPRPTSG